MIRLINRLWSAAIKQTKKITFAESLKQVEAQFRYQNTCCMCNTFYEPYTHGDTKYVTYKNGAVYCRECL